MTEITISSLLLSFLAACAVAFAVLYIGHGKLYEGALLSGCAMFEVCLLIILITEAHS